MMVAKYTLVVVRHGESTWNKENKFSGWEDVDLTESGIQQSVHAGRMIKEAGLEFDVAYTSLLKRAIKTLYYIQDESNQHHVNVRRHWRLNERMYGALQGLDKYQSAEKYGEEQVCSWRSSYHQSPPAVDISDERWPGHDIRKYSMLPPNVLPRTESIQDTVHRIRPYWHDVISQSILFWTEGTDLHTQKQPQGLAQMHG